MIDTMRWSQPATPLDDSGPPTIKNHSVTHYAGYLYCFGGYDGRRNHMTTLLYSLEDSQWIPTKQLDQPAARNAIPVEGTPPPGRNGHTATLAGDDGAGRIIIIGGWLGSGPLAASDVHVLHVSGGGTTLRWYQPLMLGTPPGPCNMHSADFVSKLRQVYVFRGGNGREYLNDLHALDVDTYQWRRVETTGCVPQQRANHSSAFLEETQELFIFGGWNGRERLNDVHILDTTTSTWTCPTVGGVLPHPRAGMTLTALRGRLFLFGGSGTSSKCFHDLQILDRKEMAWLDVEQTDGSDMVATTSRTNSRDALINPNDEESVPTVVVQGQGPGRRAGHTATPVHRRLFVFGGSCGSDYLNDFFVLDTDPPPRAVLTEPNSAQLLERRLRHFLNDQEFSDVTFVVEGKQVYGHKLVLSIVSDCFRAMFTTGFRESETNAEIEIPDCSYNAFLAMMEYIYTGRIPVMEMHDICDLLAIADQFFLDHLKQKCEQLLQQSVGPDTVEYLHSVAQRTDAHQLLAICTHYQRNQAGNDEDEENVEGEQNR